MRLWPMSQQCYSPLSYPGLGSCRMPLWPPSPRLLLWLMSQQCKWQSGRELSGVRCLCGLQTSSASGSCTFDL